MFDLLLQNGFIVDPRNGISMQGDVGITGERIAAVAPQLDPASARSVIDLTGRTLIPGIIDPHVHVSGRFGTAYGCRMMAQVGVTTGIDLAGEIEGIAAALTESGCGLTLGYVAPLIPGVSLSGADPDDTEIERSIQHSLDQGALGVKILGGHYPLTPKATAAAIRLADSRGCHIAIHAGTTETGSNIDGLEEAVRLAAGRRFHLAHVNSYCRGVIQSPLVEVERALAALRGADNVLSESYLARINGTGAQCSEGVPISNVTKTCLKQKGYPATESGLEAAIHAGDAQVHVERGGVITLQGGSEGVTVWKEKGTSVAVSFYVNAPEATFALAAAKEGDRFLVTALSTDGGSMPRNTTVEQGLAMVRYGALSLDDFVLKTSWGPATIFGLGNKTDLSVGTDADITVLDLEQDRAVMSLAHGRLVMIDGVVVGQGGRLLVTSHSGGSTGIGSRSLLESLCLYWLAG